MSFGNDFLIARAQLNKIDVSRLPYRISLSLLRARAIPEYYKHNIESPCALQLHAKAPERDSGILRWYETYFAIALDKSIETQTFNIVLWFLEHELKEVFLVNGIRVLDPHRFDNK